MTKDDLIRYFGTDNDKKHNAIQKAAKAVGITVQAIYQWKSIPKFRQLQYELISNGRLKADKKFKTFNIKG